MVVYEKFFYYSCFGEKILIELLKRISHRQPLQTIFESVRSVCSSYMVYLYTKILNTKSLCSAKFTCISTAHEKQLKLHNISNTSYLHWGWTWLSLDQESNAYLPELRAKLGCTCESEAFGSLYSHFLLILGESVKKWSSAWKMSV